MMGEKVGDYNNNYTILSVVIYLVVTWLISSTAPGGRQNCGRR